MLLQRFITAIILIPIILLFLWFASDPVFAIVTAIVVLLAGWEWTNLIGPMRMRYRIIYLLILCSLMFATMYLPLIPVFEITFVWWLLALLLLFMYKRIPVFKSKLLRALAGVFVLIPCWVALNAMFQQSDGFYAILFLFLLIWGADTAAYFIGRKFGKHKLAQNISPGKTIEGAFAALVFAVLFAILILFLNQVPIELWHFGILVACITVVFSIVGDLFESLLKREVGIKDSGKLLPGHGGLLDRIDSLTAAAPVFILQLVLITQYLES